MVRNMGLKVGSLAFCCVLAACAGSSKQQAEPQSFESPSREIAGGQDSEIVSAVEAAVDAAKKNQFHYDASGSADGRVVVTALWKARPVTLTMRFYRKADGIYIASKLTQPGDVALKGGGQEVEQLFYSTLATETARRALKIYSDPGTQP